MVRRFALWALVAAMGVGCGAPGRPATSKGASEGSAKEFHLDPRADANEAAKKLARLGYGKSKAALVVIYSTFPNRDNAGAAANEFRAKGFQAEVDELDQIGDWSCRAAVALKPGTPEFDATFVLAETIARHNGGEYDGWESASD